MLLGYLDTYSTGDCRRRVDVCTFTLSGLFVRNISQTNPFFDSFTATNTGLTKVICNCSWPTGATLDVEISE